MTQNKSINSGFHHLMHINIDKEILEVIINQLLFFFAKNAIALSVPFYLYKTLGYELWQIFSFFFFWQLAFIFMVPFAGKIVEKIGIKHSIALRNIFAMIFWGGFSLILNGDFWMDLLKFSPFFLSRGLTYSAANTSYDVFLTNHVNKKNKGQVVAWAQIAIMLSGIMAPIIGGIITKNWSFQITVLLSFILLIIGSIILILTPDEKFKLPYSPQKVTKDVIKIPPKNLFLAEIGYFFWESIIWIIWPVFLMIILKDVVSMATLVGISSGIAMVFSFFVGKKIDKSHKADENKKMIRNGAVIAFILNFFRGLIWHAGFIGAIDCLTRINNQSIKITHDVELYKWMNQENTFERAHIRQIIVQNIFTISAGLFSIIFYLFQNPEHYKYIFSSIFIVGSLCLLLTTRVSQLKPDVIKESN